MSPYSYSPIRLTLYTLTSVIFILTTFFYSLNYLLDPKTLDSVANIYTPEGAGLIALALMMFAAPSYITTFQWIFLKKRSRTNADAHILKSKIDTDLKEDDALNTPSFSTHTPEKDTHTL
jgi:hypothetical protein